MIRRLLLVAIALTAFAFWFIEQIPTASDADLADAVGKAIDKDYGKFDDRQKYEASRQGKIWYAQPVPRGHPRIDIYGVTAPEEIEAVEASARRAIFSVSGVNSIRLRFFEKKNWSAERETLVKKVEITKNG